METIAAGCTRPRSLHAPIRPWGALSGIPRAYELRAAGGPAWAGLKVARLDYAVAVAFSDSWAFVFDPCKPSIKEHSLNRKCL